MRQELEEDKTEKASQKIFVCKLGDFQRIGVTLRYGTTTHGGGRGSQIIQNSVTYYLNGTQARIKGFLGT